MTRPSPINRLDSMNQQGVMTTNRAGSGIAQLTHVFTDTTNLFKRTF